MAPDITLQDLVQLALRQAGDGRRIVVALAGPPGAGKSTAAGRLTQSLNAARPGVAALFPMDGYHFDDAVLNARGHRPRKGAPHTFDLGGYRAMLDRLRADDATDIAVPVFDRTLEIARAGADIVPGPARIIVTEGNYLLLDADGWRELRSRFDIAVFVTAPMAVIEERLRRRWLGFQYDDAALRMKMEGNDLPNVRLVLGSSGPADATLRTDGAELV